MLGTQNTEVATVPQVSSEPVKASKAKAKRQVKAKQVNQAVVKAVAEWQHGIAPDGLTKGALIRKRGQATGKVNKLGKPTYYGSLQIATPSVKSLTDADPSLSRADAEAKMRDIGQGLKPMLMARVQHAASSPDYIVRRYTETPSDKGKHKLSVSLERVHVEDTIERIARELKMTVAEVRKRLKIPEQGLTVAV